MSVGSSSRAEPLSESRVPAAVTQLEKRQGRVNEQAVLVRCSALCRLLQVQHSGRGEPWGGPFTRFKTAGVPEWRQYLTPVLGLVLCLWAPCCSINNLTNWKGAQGSLHCNSEDESGHDTHPCGASVLMVRVGYDPFLIYCYYPKFELDIRPDIGKIDGHCGQVTSLYLVTCLKSYWGFRFSFSGYLHPNWFGFKF